MIQQRTPGVYVEELSKFPPSVAGVATAIPVFIGFTAQQTKNKCEKITSLLDYSTKFGEACPLIIENGQLHGHEFVMYDSLRMFYDNGGSVCYVMSVGTYTEKDDVIKINIGNETKNWSEITAEHYKGINNAHFETLKKIDEITLLCFPDAAMLLGEEQLSTLQAAALAHCEEMKDRFAILEPRYNPSDSLDDTLKKFRGGEIGDETYTGIGSNHLKYGAAYYPYLKTSYSKDIPFETVIAYMKKKGDLASEYDDLLTKGEAKGFDFEVIKANFKATYEGKLEAEEDKIIQYITEKYAEKQDVLKIIYETDGSNALKKNEGKYIRKEFSEAVLKEIGKNIAPKNKLLLNDYQRLKIYCEVIDQLKLNNNKVIIDDEQNSYDLDSLVSELQEIVDEEIKRAQEDFDASQKLKIQASISKIDKYQDALAELQDLASIITPCGAVAGIYCATDNNKGVWQAPANISIAAAADVTEMISDKEQENMNVDAESGKSVNAIRFFSGKGILVWGARTLAGNDNEWKYISVRRLFNYIEESVQKSTAWAVFQPNDANTWTKIQCQIENFLTGLWRNGALAGSTAEQAFYVKVGLNVTMTADDITNGNLIIEIGLAAVRPAEFIILQFSHKVQEA